MSGVGSSVLSRCATANTSRSPFRADSMARSVPGRPAAIGAVSPGKMTVPRSGRTGRVWRVLIRTSGSELERELGLSRTSKERSVLTYDLLAGFATFPRRPDVGPVRAATDEGERGAGAR